MFDSTHRLIFELIERGMIDGLRIDHVDGLYDPQAYLERLQTEAAVCRGREDSRGVRAPAGDVAGARHDRLRVRGADDQLAGVQRVRSADDAPLSSVHRVRRDVRADRVREQAPGDALLARRRDRSAGHAAGSHRATRPPHGRLHARGDSRGHSRSDRVLPGLSHLRLAPRRQRRGPAHRELGGERRAQAQCRRRAERVRFPARRAARRAWRGQVGIHAARDAGVRDEVPAGDFAGRRQGRRGHGAVSLQPAGVSQRSRQRSGPLRHLVDGAAPGQRGTRASVAAHDARDLDARYEAQRRRARTHRRAQRAAGSVEASPRALDPIESQQAPAGRRRSRARPRGRVSAVSDADRRVVADRRYRGAHRAIAGLCRQGRARGQALDFLDRARTRSTRRRSAISSASCSPIRSAARS